MPVLLLRQVHVATRMPALPAPCTDYSNNTVHRTCLHSGHNTPVCPVCRQVAVVLRPCCCCRCRCRRSSSQPCCCCSLPGLRHQRKPCHALRCCRCCCRSRTSRCCCRRCCHRLRCCCGCCSCHALPERLPWLHGSFIASVIVSIFVWKCTYKSAPDKTGSATAHMLGRRAVSLVFSTLVESLTTSSLC